MKPSIFYNEGQQYNNQVFNYCEGIPYETANDYSQLNNNIPHPLILPVTKNENSPIILKLSKKMKNSKNSSTNLSCKSFKDSFKTIGDLNAFSQDSWKKFYEIDDPFFNNKDGGYIPIKTTKTIIGIDNVLYVMPVAFITVISLSSANLP